MVHTYYRLVLELSVSEAIAPDRVVRLLRDIPVPGTPIRCTVQRVPAPRVHDGREAEPESARVRVERRVEVRR